MSKSGNAGSKICAFFTLTNIFTFILNPFFLSGKYRGLDIGKNRRTEGFGGRNLSQPTLINKQFQTSLQCFRKYEAISDMIASQTSQNFLANSNLTDKLQELFLGAQRNKEKLVCTDNDEDNENINSLG